MTVAQAISVFLLLYPAIGLLVAGTICVVFYDDFHHLDTQSILILIGTWPLVLLVLMLSLVVIVAIELSKPEPRP